MHCFVNRADPIECDDSGLSCVRPAHADVAPLWSTALATEVATYTSANPIHCRRCVCRQRFARELEQQPWARKDRRYFMGREEEYVGGLRAAIEIWRKMMKGEMSREDALLVRQLLDWPGGLELHIGVRAHSSCADIEYAVARPARQVHKHDEPPLARLHSRTTCLQSVAALVLVAVSALHTRHA